MRGFRPSHVVMQPVVDVAHHDQADAADQLAGDGGPDQDVERKIVGAHTCRPMKRAITRIPTNETKARISATPVYAARLKPSASRRSTSVTTVPAVWSATRASTRDARSASQAHGTRPSNTAVDPQSQTFT